MPLEFTEYSYARSRYGALPQIPIGPEHETQVVAIGAGSAASEPFNERTELIVITKVDADCRIAIGAEPTADNAEPGMTRFLRAGSEYSFDVDGGHKLAVIAAV